MKPYSKDLRVRMLAAVDRGMRRKEVAKTYGVSEPTVRRYLRLRRQTGGVEPKPPSGPPPRKGAALEAALPSQVSRNPDLTLQEHRELFEDEKTRRGGFGLQREPRLRQAGPTAQKVLAPSLPPGRIVVMDDLGAHKSRRVRELIEARSCELLFLPPYSPDFSPIEEAFRKIKALLRRAQARQREALVEAIGRALWAVTADDARGYFWHCCYPLGAQPS